MVLRNVGGCVCGDVFIIEHTQYIFIYTYIFISWIVYLPSILVSTFLLSDCIPFYIKTLFFNCFVCSNMSLTIYDFRTV